MREAAARAEAERERERALAAVHAPAPVKAYTMDEVIGALNAVPSEDLPDDLRSAAIAAVKELGIETISFTDALKVLTGVGIAGMMAFKVRRAFPK